MNVALPPTSDRQGLHAALPRIVLTRPAGRSAHWETALRKAGFDVLGLPLLTIVPEPTNAALAGARSQLGSWDAAVFVSGNAVRFFLAGVDPEKFADATVRAWSPGLATAHALEAAGWPAARVDLPDAQAGQFDSESLWAQVAGQVHAGTRVLIVRGGDATGHVAGRQWLAQQVVAAGGVVDQVVAYRRQAPAWSPAQREAARASRDCSGDVWLFSSAEAVANLPLLSGVTHWRGTRAVVTHSRIAAAAAHLGFDVIATSRPHPPDVVAALEGDFLKTGEAS